MTVENQAKPLRQYSPNYLSFYVFSRTCFFLSSRFRTSLNELINSVSCQTHQLIRTEIGIRFCNTAAFLAVPQKRKAMRMISSHFKAATLCFPLVRVRSSPDKDRSIYLSYRERSGVIDTSYTALTLLLLFL